MTVESEIDSNALEKYRGQWGGKIASGEEMWWTEPDPKLVAGSRWARIKFAADVRQHFLLRFLRQALTNFASASAGSEIGSGTGAEAGSKPAWLSTPVIADFGCGTGGTTLNFSSYLSLPIDGYDIFETQLQIGRQFATQIQNSSRFSVLDQNGKFHLPEHSIDIIYSADVLGHVPDIPLTLSEWKRVLKPGGQVVLFTEAAYSPGDTSLSARLARDGYDMSTAVDEHISLFPREKLESLFLEAGFEISERYSANVGHFFFFPKDYVLLLKNAAQRRGIRRLALVWNRISKILPFYPWPFQLIRLAATYIWGGAAYGSGYFYLLKAEAKSEVKAQE
jgi:ubiquinone/menaquinone biosynthesis C-methylase UbiE